MSPAPASLLHRLVDDAAMFPPGEAPADEAVRRHRDYRGSWFSDLIGPLVVADQRLAEVGRHRDGETALQVSVVNTTGAGGLVSLAGREVPGLDVVAVESALRDLDDLAGNAARVVSAAEELDSGIEVYVEIPYARGWEAAVEVVEAAGLNGKIRTGGVDPENYPSAAQLAEQLSVLIEADLPFKATAGLHRAWPNAGRNAAGAALPQHGFASVLIAIHALVDGAEIDDAVAVLSSTDHDQIATTIGGWDEADAGRVRRRFRSFGCCGVTDPVHDLVSLGLIKEGR